MRKVILDEHIQLRCGQKIINSETTAIATDLDWACLVIWLTGTKDFYVFENENVFKNIIRELKAMPNCEIIWRSDHVRPIEMLKKDFGHGRSHHL